MSIFSNIINSFLASKSQKTQLVYRLCGSEELKDIEAGRMHNVGGIGADYTIKNNNHRYKKETKYLHFYSNIQDALLHKMNVYDNTILCKYCIPEYILKNYKGTGYYDAIGYDENYHVVKEYAIPSYLVDKSWLESYMVLDLPKIESDNTTMEK